jgi:hypothetical protein
LKVLLSEEGSCIEIPGETFTNAETSSDESLDAGSNLTTKRDGHPEKAHCSTVWTEAGMEIAAMDEHMANACVSIRETLETDSNVILEREMQCTKQL